MQREVEAIVLARINKVFGVNEELLRFFKNHESYPRFIQNLCQQITMAGQHYKVKMRKNTRLKLIEDLTDFFCRTAISKQDFARLSAAEKARLQFEDQLKRHGDQDLMQEIEIENAKVERGQVFKSMEGKGIPT